MQNYSTISDMCFELELKPKLDTRKSFYGKAWVKVDKYKGIEELKSYNARVAFIKDNKVYINACYYNYSQTTIRHLKEFLYQFLGVTGSLKDIETTFKDNILNSEAYIEAQR